MLNCIVFLTVIYLLTPTCSKTVTWTSDDIDISVKVNRNYFRQLSDSDLTLSILNTDMLKNWNASISFSSNAPIYDDPNGLYRLAINTGDENYVYSATTKCLPITHSVTAYKDIFQNLVMSKRSRASNHGAEQFAKLGTLLKMTFTIETNTSSSPIKDTWGLDINIGFNSTRNMDIFTMELDYTGCGKIQTIGNWNDASRWSTYSVPSSSDTVVIPEDAGIIVLENDVDMSILTMNGGILMAHDTSCPDGWSTDPVTGIKCYRLFTNASSYDAAEATCKAVGHGSLDAHLMQIRDRDELVTLQRMCRGLPGSPVATEGCWIGLREMPNTNGTFDWLQPLTVGNSSFIFLDWRRDDPNNHTTSEGVAVNGEHCTALIPSWQNDPLIEEQGSWQDMSCALEKPFVCQVYGFTEQFYINVANTAAINGGVIEGGYLVTGSGSSTITQLQARRSATIVISDTSSDTVLGNIQLSDGAVLSILCDVTTLDPVLIGEPYTYRQNNASYGSLDVLLPEPVYLPMQPQIVLDAAATMTISAATSVTFNAKVEAEGTIDIMGDATLSLLQGGLLSQATINLVNSASQLQLAGYGARLSTYDAFDLQLSNRGKFLGEFYNNISREQFNEHELTVKGIYRLQVVEDNVPNKAYQTACIPYNATASELTELLNALDVIADRGGVTVRRYGDANDIRYGYGFTYRIETDAIPRSSYDEGPISISLDCYGNSSCQCGQTKVPLVDDTKMPVCIGDNSFISGEECVLRPNIVVTRVSTLSYTATEGDGSIIVTDGIHRLPPYSTVTIGGTGGYGIVASDLIFWHGVDLSGIGTVVYAGTGWEGWDSAFVLYAPDWTYRRGFVNDLSRAPPFTMDAEVVSIRELGTLLSSCPTSNLTWVDGTWAGGIIGGRSTVYITHLLSATETAKSLRYGLTLYITDTATFHWTNGNISLGDGADIIVEGTFLVDSTINTVYIGEAQLLAASDNSTSATELLQQEPTRNWHGYFDDTLPLTVRGGWYQNPLCGDQCLATNQITIRNTGNVSCVSNSNVTFSVPLRLIGNSQLLIGYNVHITLASGGICGNDVIFDLNSGTTLELSGGVMQMQEKCTIQGEGELLVTAGAHDLAFSIDAHITISGGTMIWPETRGTHGTVTFNGGLLIDHTGKIQVVPFSTTILVHNTVELRDESVIEFPRIGIAAQASPFDERDAPDTSPRGNLTATGTMKWIGGTISGKADINSLKELFLTGNDKYIRSLAKLVNKGHCEWGTGNIITDDNGAFLNLGTVQMMNGASSFFSSTMYKGTEIPVDNGGDVFALEYHTWDDDNGGLNYLDYIALRTQFVSRAPEGWTVESQGKK